MSKAVANIEDLERLQKSVRTAEEQITEAIRRLHRDLDQAEWHDDARASFEATLKEATTSVQRTAQRLQELHPILQRKIGDLRQYLGR